MGRAPCCSKVGLHRGPWTPREDTLLTKYIQAHGEGHWRALPKKAGLLRCGKSCRLRWMNYLRPDIKRGNITPDEDDLIIRMHSLLGNRWSLIAGRLPGRTDNEIKNYWNTHLSKMLISQGTDPCTHKKLSDLEKQNRAPKRRKRPTNSYSKSNHNDESQNSKTCTKIFFEQAEKHKIHLPKPVRFLPNKLSLPRNDSLVSFESTLSSISQCGEPMCYGDVDYGNDNNNNNKNNEASFLVGDGSTSDDQELECESMDNINSLDKLYEEYLQLLKTEGGNCLDLDQVQLDSFAESLLL